MKENIRYLLFIKECIADINSFIAEEKEISFPLVLTKTPKIRKKANYYLSPQPLTGGSQPALVRFLLRTCHQN